MSGECLLHNFQNLFDTGGDHSTLQPKDNDFFFLTYGDFHSMYPPMLLIICIVSELLQSLLKRFAEGDNNLSSPFRQIEECFLTVHILPYQGGRGLTPKSPTPIPNVPYPLSGVGTLEASRRD